MTEFAIDILVVIVAVIAHESSHFAVAYWYRLFITRVTIGSADYPKVFQFHWKGILFIFTCWPFGGCVSYLVHDKPRRVHRYFLVAIAGPVSDLSLAILLATSGFVDLSMIPIVMFCLNTIPRKGNDGANAIFWFKKWKRIRLNKKRLESQV